MNKFVIFVVNIEIDPVSFLNDFLQNANEHEESLMWQEKAER